MQVKEKKADKPDRFKIFADVLLAKTKGTVFKKSDLAHIISQIERKLKTKRAQISSKTFLNTDGDIYAYVSKARVYLENEENTTIVNIPNYGYKLGDKNDCHVFGIKTLRRTVAMNVRASRITKFIKPTDFDGDSSIDVAQAIDRVTQAALNHDELTESIKRFLNNKKKENENGAGK